MNKRFSLFLLVTFISGCVTAPRVVEEPQKPIFYPSLPEEPRLQFLTSFSSSDDIELKASSFKKFIIGEEDKKVRPIVKPYGVAVSGNKIYICDTVNNSIVILDLAKRKFEYFRPKQESRLIEPINLCFDNSGNMYVADSRRGQVVIFDAANNYLGAIGGKSEFKPTSVSAKGGRIYICDLKSHSVRVYNLSDKQYLFSIPKENAKEEAKLFSPTNITLDEEGNLYVSDTGAFRIQKYSSSGEFLMTIGSHGDSPSQFARPKGVAVDKEGRIYAIDAAFENVQIFDKQGKLLLFFAEPGSGVASLVLPAGIAIDYTLKDYFSDLIDPGFSVDYLVLVTSQYGDRKLNVFGFGRKK